MKWSNEKPGRPGWYWWRTQKYGLQLVQLLYLNHTLELIGKAPFWKESKGMYEMNGQWAGPLTPPEEAPDEA